MSALPLPPAPQGKLPASPSFLGQGGTGRKIGGYIGDALLSLSGQQPFYARTMAERPELELERQIKQLQLQRLQRPENKQVVNWSGGVGAFDPETGTLSQLATAPPKDDRPSLQQNYEWIKTLPPEEQKAALRMMPGAAYLPEVMQQRVTNAGAVAEAQGAARERHRAPAKPSAPKYEYRTGPNGELQRRRIG